MTQFTYRKVNMDDPTTLSERVMALDHLEKMPEIEEGDELVVTTRNSIIALVKKENTR